MNPTDAKRLASIEALADECEAAGKRVKLHATTTRWLVDLARKADFSVVTQPGDYDICECGDYRHQHELGWRGCSLCVPSDGMSGRECLRFRLASLVTWITV